MPDFLKRSIEHQQALGAEGLDLLSRRAARWKLSNVLKSGGVLVFPHATISVCGDMIAAVVMACFDSGASTVVALGPIHATTPELQQARVRVAGGGDPADEPLCSIQGPGIAGWSHYRAEFALSHFEFLWDCEAQRRGGLAPELILRYPFLCGCRPDLLPGVEELEEITERPGTVVVATIDPFHHGIGYGESSEEALFPENGGLSLARLRTEENMQLLCSGDYAEYNSQCIEIRSDGRDVGQLLAYLRSPGSAEILDLITDDMSGPYDSPAPTWVAGALIALHPAAKNAHRI